MGYYMIGFMVCALLFGVVIPNPKAQHDMLNYANRVCYNNHSVQYVQPNSFGGGKVMCRNGAKFEYTLTERSDELR